MQTFYYENDFRVPTFSIKWEMMSLSLLLLLGIFTIQGIPSSNPLGENLAPAFQTTQYGSADANTVVYCDFNTDLTCQTPSGVLNPIKSTYASASGGVFGSNAATIPENGAVGMYSSNGFSYQMGTIEAWINPNSTGTRPQYLFSAQGGKSLDKNSSNDYVFGESSTNPPSTQSKIFFGTGSGLNTSNPLTFDSNVVRGISVGDVDGDKNLDLVVSNNGFNRVNIYKGPFLPGQHLSKPTGTNALTVAQPQGHVLADLDLDGDLDILVSSYHPSTAPVFGFKNNGSGVFSAMTFNFGPLTEPAEAMDIGDVDQDGVLDVVFASFSADPYKPSLLLYGIMDGNGNYTLDIADSNHYQVLDNTILGVRIADVNNDGWLDIIEADVANNKLIIRYNDGTGHLPYDATHRVTISTSRPFTLSTADIDNDGYLDIGVTNYKPNGVTDNNQSRFFRGPTFSTTKTFDVNNGVSLSVGDLDGDWLNDVGYHSSTGTVCPIYLLDVNGNTKSKINITCQATWGSPNGPGAGVHAAAQGTSPYGRNFQTFNSTELFYNPTDGKIHFQVHDTYGLLHEVSANYSPDGNMQKVQAEWNFAQKRLRLIIGNPAAGGVDVNYTAANPIVFEHAPINFLLGTAQNNQYSLNGTMDEFRLSFVERGT